MQGGSLFPTVIFVVCVLTFRRARAEAVLMALLDRQVDVSGMRAVGYGETVPIADNGTAAGRAENRRVAIIIDNG